MQFQCIVHPVERNETYDQAYQRTKRQIVLEFLVQIFIRKINENQMKLYAIRILIKKVLFGINFNNVLISMDFIP